jgi:hypothetical protein
MTDPTAHRVYRRFIAATIGDPVELFAQFRERIVAHVCREEGDAPSEAKKIQDFLGVRGRGGEGELEAALESALEADLKSTYKLRLGIKAVMGGLWYKLRQNTGENLCLALLQQYELPPAIRKKVENATKFWSKSRFGAPRTKARSGTVEYDLVMIEGYQRLCEELHDQERLFADALAKGRRGDDPEVAATRKVNVGPFTVVNTGGFDEATMRGAVDIVREAARVMEAVGLGKVCYGDVLISQRIQNNRNVLAFYLPAHDEMFIRAEAPKEEDTLRTVCHELAHRLEHKFLSSKKREIERLYRGLKNHDLSLVRDLPAPTIGDTITDKGKPFLVTGFDPIYESVKLTPVDPKDAAAPEGRRVQFSISLVGYHEKKGLRFDSSFVTSYAKTSAGENFAEMVSFYALGKLPAALVGPLEAILTG